MFKVNRSIKLAFFCFKIPFIYVIITRITKKINSGYSCKIYGFFINKYPIYIKFC